ncbi:hypothetical protein FB440_106235 [Vibrio crassostreae]|uniref:hypothetical protein n=1 Tax=Vibrio crassostreae TaxID=246167 RepID=UPI00119A2BF2|nr:hypothetical protein [Vibrio crassostreae]TWD39674.1 hypothetical protein FB440_106235 [Vibrio crassostreae]
MRPELNTEQVQTLLHLVRAEMDGFCGDRGYEELSKIKIILEQELENSTTDLAN